jgi:hypothetical protein
MYSRSAACAEIGMVGKQPDTKDKFSPLELMILQTNALVTWDKNGRMLMSDEPWDGTRQAPKFCLGRTIDGKTLLRFRHDIPDSIINELERLSADETPAESFEDMPKHKDKYLEIFETNEFSSGPCWLVPPDSTGKKMYEKTWIADNSGTEHHPLIPVLITKENINNFTLDSKLDPKKGFEWLKDEITVAEPCAGLIINGHLVSQCRSVRRSSTAHEAGLETLPDFRGHGYAMTVTLGWAAAVRDLGALPFYTTSWQNTNSQNVARKLGLYYYGNSFSVN